jgi:hypothetical protein
VVGPDAFDKEPVATSDFPAPVCPPTGPRIAPTRLAALAGTLLATLLLLIWAVSPASAFAAPSALASSGLAPAGLAQSAVGLAPEAIIEAASTPAAVNQCNGTDNVGGQAVACDVTITNNLNLVTGTSGSTVLVKECHGAANAGLTCTTSTTPSVQLTTSVVQCDGSGSGGGGTVTCNVHVTNNITGVATPTPATVNQCNGSGTGGGTQPTLQCDPLGSTTGATVTQCNGSGNGGGATVRVQCTVTPSTQTSALPVTVDQCNGSGNGGGSLVTCSGSVTNTVLAPAAAPTTTSTTPGTTVPGATTVTTAPGATVTTAPGVTPVTSPPVTLAPAVTPETTPVTTPPALAVTGSDTGRLLVVALLAILLGGVLSLLSLVSHRRRHASTRD